MLPGRETRVYPVRMVDAHHFRSAPVASIALASAWQLYQLGQFGAAVVAVQQHLAQAPEDSEAQRLLAHAALDDGDTRTALTAAAKAVLLSPADAHAYFAMSLGNQRAGNPDVAEQAIREALRLDPQESKFYAALADQLIESGQWAAAATVAREGLTLDPVHEYLLYARAMITWADQHPNIALEQADEGLGIIPESSQLHSLRGAILLELGRKADAIASLQEALRLEPRNALAEHHLRIARSWHYRLSTWHMPWPLALLVAVCLATLVFVLLGYLFAPK
jgi:Flp pilus assembly protein TadD